jgi:hypothetical protein
MFVALSDVGDAFLVSVSATLGAAFATCCDPVPEPTLALLDPQQSRPKSAPLSPRIPITNLTINGPAAGFIYLLRFQSNGKGPAGVAVAQRSHRPPAARFVAPPHRRRRRDRAG